ncbi:MAG: hypothetical protein ACI9FJ_002832, partial [Alteromonadaceae bacterium]
CQGVFHIKFKVENQLRYSSKAIADSINLPARWNKLSPSSRSSKDALL